jgi:hypothetical protein
MAEIKSIKMRRLFTAASAFLLVICFAATLADVVSRLTTFGWTSHHHHWSAGVFQWAATTHNHDLVVSQGILYDMGEDSSDTLMTGRLFVDERQVLSRADLQGLNRDQPVYGFSWHETRRTWGDSGRYVERHWQKSAPLWPFVVLSGILPTRWMFTFFRTRRRIRSGHCPDCGYDLRASTERCPECGRPITSQCCVIA